MLRPERPAVSKSGMPRAYDQPKIFRHCEIVGARDARALLQKRPKHEQSQSLPKLRGAWRTPRARLLSVLNNQRPIQKGLAVSSPNVSLVAHGRSKARRHEKLWISERKPLTVSPISYIMLTRKSGHAHRSTACPYE